MKKLRFLLAFIFCHCCLLMNAAKVDTVAIFSNSMQKSFNAVVITPNSYDKVNAQNWIPNRYPTVYLLHGYSGSYNNWIQKVPAITQLADEYQLMIVCPDGDYSSWYVDSPVDSTVKFETYISTEVPQFIDAHYRTRKSASARAITGLSMGGHGGLFLGFRHSDIFGACGSMSGGVDLKPFPKNWEISKKLGDTAAHWDNWVNYSVTHIVETKPASPLSIIIDCGTEDFFYDVNKALHEKLLKLKIAHDYIERPGKHDWAYWGNAVKYQLLFFRDFFERTSK